MFIISGLFVKKLREELIETILIKTKIIKQIREIY